MLTKWVFILEGSINSTPVNGVLDTAFLNQQFQNAEFCLRKISMNAAQKCAFTIVVRAKR